MYTKQLNLVCGLFIHIHSLSFCLLRFSRLDLSLSLSLSLSVSRFDLFLALEDMVEPIKIIPL